MLSSAALTAILAIAAGIFILVQPKFLNYTVAIFLIVYGVLQLIPFIR